MHLAPGPVISIVSLPAFSWLDDGHTARPHGAPGFCVTAIPSAGPGFGYTTRSIMAVIAVVASWQNPSFSWLPRLRPFRSLVASRNDPRDQLAYHTNCSQRSSTQEFQQQQIFGLHGDRGGLPAD